MVAGIDRNRDDKGRFIKASKIKKPPLTMNTNAVIREISAMNFGGTFIKLDFSNFFNFAKDVLSKSSDKSLIKIEGLKFIINSGDLKVGMSLDEISAVGILPIDYFEWTVLTNLGYEIEVSINADQEPYDSVIAGKVLVYLVFIGFTRGKFSLGPDESMPKFCESFLGLNMPRAEIERYTSVNNINNLNSTFLQNIDVRSLGDAFYNRIKAGIAGSRYFNVFKDYKFKENISREIKEKADMIAEIARGGPYYEMHPFMVPNNLKGISIGKNLANLILETFSEDSIKEMVKNKSLYSKPVFSSNHSLYLQWDSTFKNNYKTTF
jgi:hypothetical protein